MATATGGALEVGGRLATAKRLMIELQDAIESVDDLPDVRDEILEWGPEPGMRGIAYGVVSGHFAIHIHIRHAGHVAVGRKDR